MPQMAPLNWLALFLLFALIFIWFNVMNYFTFSYKIKMDFFKIKTMTYNWKW